jgi:hypothetical protein
LDIAAFSTDDGVTGYVSSDELGPAPPEPKPTPIPDARRTASAGKPKHSDVRGTPESPLFDVNDVPMPLPGNPEPRAQPKLRY